MCKNYRELELMIEAIDYDGSGQVEFSEFLKILKGHKKAYSRPELNQKFIQTEFKEIMRGTHKNIKMDQDMSLNMILRNYKRKIILSRALFLEILHFLRRRRFFYYLLGFEDKQTCLEKQNNTLYIMLYLTL